MESHFVGRSHSFRRPTPLSVVQVAIAAGGQIVYPDVKIEGRRLELLQLVLVGWVGVPAYLFGLVLPLILSGKSREK